MAMRITGMYSGLDTESIIQELVKAKSVKVDKIKKDKTKHEWKSEAWSGLNTKIKAFQSSISSMRFSTAYKKKTTSVSNSSAVSVITGESAMNGVQKLSIKRLAKSGYLTGAKLKTADGTAVTSDTTLAELRLKTNSDGSEASGIPAISSNGSFTVKTGDKSVTVEVNAEMKMSEIVGKLKNAGIDANFDEKNGRIFLASTTSGYDADFSITADNAIGFSALSVLGINESLDTSTATEPNSNEKTLATYQKLASYSATLSGITNASDFMEGIDINSDLYKAIKAEMESDDDYEAAISKLTEKATFAAEIIKADSSFTAAMYSGDAVRIAGADAEIELNGVTYKSGTNNIEVNGLTFTALSVADDISVTTQEDTDGIYDMIRDIFKQYNELINEMDKLYNADSASKFQPLTDDEKDEMSEKEVEKWEQKIKDSILRRDTGLGTIAQTLKDTMAKGYEVNGKKLYLANFGIETMSYFLAKDNEKNAYHIAGDDKDSDVSGNADKLKSMIANDPDTVVSFFTQLARELNSEMSNLSKATDDQSFGSFYSDKKFKSDLTDYESKIKDAEKKLADYEDKYYSKFSKMEVALSKLESSTSSITSLLGGNN